MIKRLFLLDGILGTPLHASGTRVELDAISGAYILQELSFVDWAYALVNQSELVRIHVDDLGLRLDRGVDSTIAHSYPAGVSIKYAITQSELQDASAIFGVVLRPDSHGVADISGAAPNWSVGYAPITFNTVGGVDVSIRYNDIIVYDRIGAFGCCGESVTGAPDIDGPIFYLTSTLYPLLATESMAGYNERSKSDAANRIPPFSWQIWTAPYGYMQANAQPLGGDLWGGAESYTISSEGLAHFGAVPLDGDLYGGAVQYNAYVPEYLSVSGYPLEGQLYGNAVNYNNYVDAYLSVGLISISGELV